LSTCSGNLATLDAQIANLDGELERVASREPWSDPVAWLCSFRGIATRTALREALQGRFTAHRALLVGQMLAQIDFLDETIATLSAQVEELTRPFSRELEPTRSSPPPTTSWTKASPATSSARSSSTAGTPRTPNATAAG
jgi:hypothetical protein